MQQDESRQNSIQTPQVISKLIDIGNGIFRKRHTEVGAIPGTLAIPDDAVPPKIHMICYDTETSREQDIQNINDLQAAFDPSDITWIDVQGFGDRKSLQKIGEIFSIHPLAMEDIVNLPQRPKAEVYGNQVLIITRMVRVLEDGEVDMEQVTLLLGEKYVLSFQERYGDILDPVRKRIRNGKGRPIREQGSAYLAYAIVDTIVPKSALRSPALAFEVGSMGEDLDPAIQTLQGRPSS